MENQNEVLDDQLSTLTKDNEQRAHQLKVAFWLLLALSVASLVSAYMHLEFLQSGIELDEAAQESDDLRQGLVGIAYFAGFILVVTFFIMWFRRAYYNIIALGTVTDYKDDGALWSWFIPFVNIVRPRKIMGEIWDNTQRLAKVNELKSQALLNWWWGFWLLSSLISNISFRVTNAAKTAEQILTAAQLDLFSDIMDVASTLLAIYVVQQVAEFEKKMREVI